MTNHDWLALHLTQSRALSVLQIQESAMQRAHCENRKDALCIPRRSKSHRVHNALCATSI